MTTRIIRHTSDICWCVTYYTYEDSVPAETVEHTDVAIIPCRIHGAEKFGNMLLASDASPDVQKVVRANTSHRVVIVEVTERPKAVRGVITMAETVAHRGEMYRKEDAKAVLLNLPEFGLDGPNGREFKVEPVVTFDAERKMTISVGGSVEDREKARRALDATGVTVK